MVFLLVRLGIRHIFLLILPNVYIFNSYLAKMATQFRKLENFMTKFPNL